jgi:predicted SnoaL-like aldol condensation-catalyzing enzyme
VSIGPGARDYRGQYLGRRWIETRNSELETLEEAYLAMNHAVESSNKALVLEAFDTLFNKRDYVAAEHYWSPDYIQHSAHIEPGRDGLFSLIKNVPSTLRYEPGVIVAEGDFVIVHGRFSGHGRPKSWIAADILRIVDGVLVEHWDVLQDEASQAESKSGLPMFGDSFTE